MPNPNRLRLRRRDPTSREAEQNAAIALESGRAFQKGKEEGMRLAMDQSYRDNEILEKRIHQATIRAGRLALAAAEVVFPEWWGGDLSYTTVVQRRDETEGWPTEDNVEESYEFANYPSFVTSCMAEVIAQLPTGYLRRAWRGSSWDGRTRRDRLQAMYLIIEKRSNTRIVPNLDEGPPSELFMSGLCTEFLNVFETEVAQNSAKPKGDSADLLLERLRRLVRLAKPE